MIFIYFVVGMLFLATTLATITAREMPVKEIYEIQYAVYIGKHTGLPIVLGVGSWPENELFFSKDYHNVYVGSEAQCLDFQQRLLEKLEY